MDEKNRSRLCWKPDSKRVASTNLTRYQNWLEEKRGLSLSSYGELYNYSIDERASFWSSLWEYFDVIHSEGYGDVLENPDDMLGSRWFIGAKMNFAENLLRYRDERQALVFRGERPSAVKSMMTYDDLYVETAQIARSLLGMDVNPGDRIAGFIPNICETVASMLAATSAGAVWSSCSPDFGFQGALDRFSQIEPKVLFTVDGYYYNGKSFSLLKKIARIVEALPSIEKVVVVPLLDAEPDISSVPKAVLYTDFKTSGPVDIQFKQLPFDHPAYILYSSGTTGVPKCMVHSAGGTLLQHLKELVLHTDLKRKDRIFYFTTCGWMMWNWLVSSLAVGATVLLYDGSPFYPDSKALWKFAEEERMTVFGTSAKYISALEKDGLKPGEEFDMSSLRALLSTGSPLSEENFRYVYRDIKADLQLSSISGGSDIVSCFALGCPVLPVWEGELQCRGLGMAVDVFDTDGNPVAGHKGELVCKASFPSQPIFFWNDPDKERYRSAYFKVFENIWHHGDYAELTEHGGLIIYGRSDATLNPGGVRIGTAEIYRPVEAMDEVLDSLVVGQSWGDDVRVILFVKLAPGVELTEDLAKGIKGVIRKNCTPRHVPRKVIQITDIPYTISGKKVEIAVRKIIEGQEVKNRDALKNPRALDLYKDIAELKD